MIPIMYTENKNLYTLLQSMNDGRVFLLCFLKFFFLPIHELDSLSRLTFQVCGADKTSSNVSHLKRKILMEFER